ncbi:hypothetical protein [Paludisphaera mucosa]|uniref:Uncharacterized protein n=1 Tax=Paludisphaera mucosa TaxID=3030827 RepID=A0ABT6F7M3_9BACT|nr:hypothetical protein [Paludisphaera mucosa]MDG3003579.1 hypothetical protein [Paludisphaera mucosa]
MTRLRTSLICGSALVLGSLAGCTKEEPVQPPPAPAPAAAEPAKDAAPARGSSKVDAAASSSGAKDSTVKP